MTRMTSTPSWWTRRTTPPLPTPQAPNRPRRNSSIASHSRMLATTRTGPPRQVARGTPSSRLAAGDTRRAVGSDGRRRLSIRRYRLPSLRTITTSRPGSTIITMDTSTIITRTITITTGSTQGLGWSWNRAGRPTLWTLQETSRRYCSNACK